jgi:flagellar FliL protein
MTTQAHEQEEVPPVIVTIAIVAVPVARGRQVAAGCSWAICSPHAHGAPSRQPLPPKAVKEKARRAGGAAHLQPANGIVLLDPITSNLAYPSDNRVRLEVALLFKDAAGRRALGGNPPGHHGLYAHRVAAADRRDRAASNISGKTSMERVDLRVEGRVTNVMFRGRL